MLVIKLKHSLNYNGYLSILFYFIHPTYHWYFSCINNQRFLLLSRLWRCIFSGFFFSIKSSVSDIIMNKTEEQWKSMIGNDSHLYNDQESPGEYLWTVTPSKGMPTYLILVAGLEGKAIYWNFRAVL